MIKAITTRTFNAERPLAILVEKFKFVGDGDELNRDVSQARHPLSSVAEVCVQIVEIQLEKSFICSMTIGVSGYRAQRTLVLDALQNNGFEVWPMRFDRPVWSGWTE